MSNSLRTPKIQLRKSIAMVAALSVALLVGGAVEARGAGGGLATDAHQSHAAKGKKAKKGKRGKAAKGERRYKRLWKQRVSKRNKRWAKRTARCESGGNPKAIGGGGKYRGAFQFLRSTWRASPRSPGGDPIAYSFQTQAVVAVGLKTRDGSHHWPNCG